MRRYAKNCILLLIVISFFLLNCMSVLASDDISRWDFITEIGDISAVKAELALTGGKMQVNYSGISKNTVAQIRMNNIKIDNSLHKYFIIDAELPENISSLRLRYHTSASEGTSVETIKRIGEGSNKYVFDIGSVPSGTYAFLRIDIIGTSAETVDTGTIFVDSIELSQTQLGTAAPSGLEAIPDNVSFFQKNNDGIFEMTWNEKRECFVANDSIATISQMGIMPSKEYSVIQRYTVIETGRHRVAGVISSKDKKGGGNVIRIYKNSELVRELFCPSGKDVNIDVRMFAEANDIIDVEASIAVYEGHNYAEWSVTTSPIPGTIFNNDMTTTEGGVYKTLSIKSLSEYVENVSANSSKIYAVIQGKKYEMEYDTDSKKWVSPVSVTRGISKATIEQRQDYEDYRDENPRDDIAYVTPSTVRTSGFVGTGNNVYIDIPVQSDGAIVVDGEFNVTSQEDGELINLYLNGEKIWSNRIGGEVSQRWDEEYDTKYFINDIHAAVSVNKGDVLTFEFNRWRKNGGSDLINISGVTIKQVESYSISKETKWKLDNSIVLDTKTNKLYYKGDVFESQFYMKDGTTYISKEMIGQLFENNVDTSEEYVPIRKCATENGKNVEWIANQFVIIHGGIPGMYTWNESNEIELAYELKGGAVFE